MLCVLWRFESPSTIRRYPMRVLLKNLMLEVQSSILHVRTFGVCTWCKLALKSDSRWLMSTRILYSARIDLLVRQYVMGATKAARKPIQRPWTKSTETDCQKQTEFHGIPKFCGFRKRLATSKHNRSISKTLISTSTMLS